MTNQGKKFDVDIIRHFLEGVGQTLLVQCETKVLAGKPLPVGSPKPYEVDIAAIIGITSSTFNGSLCLSFPEATFLSVMEGMVGERYEKINPDVQDGAGELLNIIFGHAKKVLNDRGYDIQKAIPSVITGQKVNLQHISKNPSLIIPFTSNKGDFYIDIALQD